MSIIERSPWQRGRDSAVSDEPGPVAPKVDASWAERLFSAGWMRGSDGRPTGAQGTHDALPVTAPVTTRKLANPPSSDPYTLLPMTREEYDLAQKAYFKHHGRFAGSLSGLPTLFAHEVRETLEYRRDLDAKQLCLRFLELFPLTQHADARSWLRVGLRYALDDCKVGMTPEIEKIRDQIVNGQDVAWQLLNTLALEDDAEREVGTHPRERG